MLKKKKKKIGVHSRFDGTLNLSKCDIIIGDNIIISPMADIAIQVWHVRPEHILGHSTMRDAWLVSSHATFQIKLRLRVSESAQPWAPSLPFSSRWTKSKDKLPTFRSDLGESFQFTSGFTHFCHFHFYHSSQSYSGFPYSICPEGCHCRAEQG